MRAEQLPKRTAFGIFASDALSSIGYAPGELLHQFTLAGVAAVSLGYLLPISLAIIAAAWIVIALYRVVIAYYPHGGGTYTVAKEHLGEIPSLIAAAALLVDYTLTVSVSVTSGVAQMGAILPFFNAHRVAVCIIIIICVAYINLRGYRESGNFFAIPLYGFLSAFSLLLIAGLVSWLKGTLPHAEQFSATAVSLTGGVGIFLIMRAFTSGCSALTGIEAVSNGVPVFREPSPKNARTTIVMLGIVISVFLLGTAALTRSIGVVPENQEILIPALGSIVFGSLLPPLLAKIAVAFLAAAICVILLIAANTSFSGLPHLSSVLAKDGYLPRQFRNRGNRQVYSTGIIALVVASSLLVWFFGGRVSPLIPLYGIGVFTTFSILGWSMVAHVVRPNPAESDANAPRDKKTLLTGIAAGIISTVVLGIFLVTKFVQGAFATVIVMPLLVLLFRKIRKSYTRYKEGLRLETGRAFRPRHVSNTVIIAVARIDKATLKGINRAQDIVGKKIAVHVMEETDDDAEFRRQWESLGTGIPLIILRSEYNSLTDPLIRYIKNLLWEENAKEMKDPSYVHHLYVVLEEIIPNSFTENILHNQTAFFIYEQLRTIPEITPIIVRYAPSQLPPSATWINSRKQPKKNN